MEELEYSRNENLDNFYSDLLNELDFNNTEIILTKIKNIIDEKSLITAQKLHAIGLIIDKNKEAYIAKLRRDNHDLQKKIDQLENGELIKNHLELGKRFESLCQKQKDMKIEQQKINQELEDFYKIRQSNIDLKAENKRLRKLLEPVKHDNTSIKKKIVVVRTKK